MGRCKCLGSWKSFLWYALLSGASILFFSILNPLGLHRWGHWSGWWTNSCNTLCLLVWQTQSSSTPLPFLIDGNKQAWMPLHFLPPFDMKSESESHSVISDSLQPHGILQARILEWVALPFSRGSSRPRNQIGVSHIAGRFFTSRATREAPNSPGMGHILKQAHHYCSNNSYYY